MQQLSSVLILLQVLMLLKQQVNESGEGAQVQTPSILRAGEATALEFCSQIKATAMS